jgi:Rha family phage regulatory protein
MNNLQIIKRGNVLMVDSREVAEMVDKNHAHLLRDIKGYIDILNQSNFGFVDFFIPSAYVDGKGETRPRYLITRKGCDMVANKMTGEKGVLFTATYVTKFEEMENAIKIAIKDSYMITDPIERAKAWIVEAEKTKALTHQLALQRPKVIFAEALEVSSNTILIGELAKILRQNGINIGQNRLFEKLRADGYLIKRGEGYNQPTQYSMELGLMEIKKRTINNPDGSVRATTTTKVTGKGQIYFVNKLKAEKEQKSAS